MSEGGERTCPLCAEEMDLTDQHLKPCKCGYEICVWCWHHVMDMAEKDETEGRCPACRMPYNREKVVGMTANCEKLVSEMNVEKKSKLQKGKNKTSDGRKQLESVRVIQRNLVYVVGLPLNFADEDLLLRKEYFVQYGKVLKVSISRTAAGAIQQFANGTCSVYITYSKEDEAIRCIQSVNGFVLDGRPLRACFGTTKYCHAWLRNMPCSNADCLYLHEIGSHEDSFTKDEVISAYTRNRVQQITGATNSMQQRLGNILPPPTDEYCNNNAVSSGKLINKTATSTNISASSAGVSPPNSSCGRSTAFPPGASWGTCASCNHLFSTSTPCSNGPLKPDAFVASPSEVTCPSQVSSLPCNYGNKSIHDKDGAISQDKVEMEIVVPVKRDFNSDCVISMLDSSAAFLHPATSLVNQSLYDLHTSKPSPNAFKMVNSSLKSTGPALDHHSMDATDKNINNICSDFSSREIHDNVEQIRAPVNSEASEKVANATEEVSATCIISDCTLRILTPPTKVSILETEDDSLSFDNQRLEDPEVISNRNGMSDFFNSFNLLKHSSVRSSQFNVTDGSTSVGFDQKVIDMKGNLIVPVSSSPIMSSGHPYNLLNSPEIENVEYSNFFPSKDKNSLLGRYEGEIATGSGNIRENNIISNILSMDFDSLDESLTSPQNLAKLLGDNDKRQGTFGISSPWKIQDSNQSRFSFAREEEPMDRISDFGMFTDLEQDLKKPPIGHDLSGNNRLRLDKFTTQNDFLGVSGTESDVYVGSHSHISSNKFSISRSQISAPPGFSGLSRSPPPGFSSYERPDQILGTLPGNHMLDATSLKNQWQTPPSSNNFSSGDIEFMDPAILEVRYGTVPGGISSPGRDIRSNYSQQFSSYEEARLQSFLQRSHPPLPNQRMNDLVDGLPPIGNAYGVRSRVVEQTLSNKFSPFSQFSFPKSRNAVASNGQWNGWNEGLSGNNFSMAELLRNERLGFNKFYGGYEDLKVRMSSSGNMYNGSYGI